MAELNCPLTTGGRDTGNTAYPPGSRIALRIDGREDVIKATVVRGFVPFTKSQVFLVETPISLLGMQTTRLHDLPFLAVLKIYDPRYLDERFGLRSRPDRPWSAFLEADAARRRRLVSLGVRPPDEFDESLLFADEEDFLSGQTGWPSLDLLYEEHFFRLSTGSYRYEKKSYEQLASFQGRAIPLLYATGNLLSPPATQRSIEPPMILIEYVPGESLSKAKEPPRIPTSVVSPVIAAAEDFPAKGVIHGDINPGNIIISPPSPAIPKRVVLVDFGCSWVRGNQADEQWRTNVHFCGDARRLKKVLNRFAVLT